MTFYDDYCTIGELEDMSYTEVTGATKAKFEQFLEEDTDIGKAFVRLLLPLLPQDQQEAMRSTLLVSKIW